MFLQGLFAVASTAYLLASAWLEHTTGAPLSAAPIAPSLLMFAVYFAVLLLPRLGRIDWYRAATALAILVFGGGGVIGNIMRYIETGLAEYASFAAWLVAVGINAYGTVLNVIAALGLFRRSESQYSAS